jgi:gamma-glutamyl hydrolase
MAMLLLLLVVLFPWHGLVVEAAVLPIRGEEVATYHPVIGVLTLPEETCLRYGDQVIVTSNARWLQAGGARVVPIYYDSSPEELDFVLSRVNGVFWTGGNVDFNPHTEATTGSQYLRATEHMLRYVIRENIRGNYYPLWGTCLGFERLLQLIAEDDEALIVEAFDAENYPINLGFTDPAWDSRLFRSMSDELFAEVASPRGRLAFNNHGLGIHPDSFRNNSLLSEHMNVLSVDLDRNGKPFISTVEGKAWPFYATQWHPEKPPWEWNPTWRIERNDLAIQLSNYFGRFFVNECRYNKNRFESLEVEDSMLLHNWVSIPSSAIRKINPKIWISFTELYCIDRNQTKTEVTSPSAPATAKKLKRFPIM